MDEDKVKIGREYLYRDGPYGRPRKCAVARKTPVKHVVPRGVHMDGVIPDIAAIPEAIAFVKFLDGKYPNDKEVPVPVRCLEEIPASTDMSEHSGGS